MKPTSQTFTMEMHCCGSDDDQPELRLELHDGGGGDYLVLHAKHWALDSEAEIDALCDKMKSLLPKTTN